MNERQWEAMDLIVKAWTSHDGPVSHEGRFFHHRNINIWPRPYQQPHPPIWVSHHHARAAPGASARAATCRRRSSPASRARPRSSTPIARAGATPAAAATFRSTGWPMRRWSTPARPKREARAGAEKLLWYMTANKVPLHFCYPPGYVPTPVARADPARRGRSTSTPPTGRTPPSTRRSRPASCSPARPIRSSRRSRRCTTTSAASGIC